MSQHNFTKTEVDKRPNCPFCNSTKKCKHLALKIDDLWHETDGGFIEKEYQLHMILLDKFKNFDYKREYYKIQKLLESVTSFAYTYVTHNQSPGMTSSNTLYFSENKNKAISEFKILSKKYFYDSKFYSGIKEPKNSTHMLDAVINNEISICKVGLYLELDDPEILYICNYESNIKHKWKISLLHANSSTIMQDPYYLLKAFIQANSPNVIAINPGKGLTENQVKTLFFNDLKEESASYNNHDIYNPLSPNYDPIASAMKRHTKLTREEAEEMAKLFGF
jgi:hypothetical protein